MQQTYQAMLAQTRRWEQRLASQGPEAQKKLKNRQQTILASRKEELVELVEVMAVLVPSSQSWKPRQEVRPSPVL